MGFWYEFIGGTFSEAEEHAMQNTFSLHSFSAIWCISVRKILPFGSHFIAKTAIWFWSFCWDALLALNLCGPVGAFFKKGKKPKPCFSFHVLLKKKKKNLSEITCQYNHLLPKLRIKIDYLSKYEREKKITKMGIDLVEILEYGWNWELHSRQMNEWIQGDVINLMLIIMRKNKKKKGK